MNPDSCASVDLEYVHVEDVSFDVTVSDFTDYSP